MPQPVRVISVDLEEYFHVEAFADIISRSSWDSYASRVEPSTARLLDMFDETGTKATFFSLGWVAERHPGIIREIVRRGHEVACHSYWHRLVYRLSPEEFRADTMKAKDVIEQVAGVAVNGYRAPCFSITARTPWALPLLAECGFLYDSSIFPIRHDIYGIPDAPRTHYRTPQQLLEFPMTTFRFLGSNWPVGGGGYLRLAPWWLTRAGLRRVAAEGHDVILYVHPWELDPAQPRLNGRWLSRLRHYRNLEQTEARLRSLLASVPYTSFRDSFPLAGQVAPTLDSGRRGPVISTPE
jgi:polysaccharide deacetylase family protein (PEP-CTERM system associated)